MLLSVSSGVKVATFIRTCWRTRAVLPSLLAGFAGYDAPRAVFPSIVHVRGGFTGAVLGPGVMPVVVASGAFGQTALKTVEISQLQFLDKVVQISCRCAEADSHGPDCFSDQRNPPVAGQNDRRPCCAGRVAAQVMVLTCRKLWFSTVAVPVTLVTCPLLRTTGLGGAADAVLFEGRRHPCLYAEADPHGPVC